MAFRHFSRRPARNTRETPRIVAALCVVSWRCPGTMEVAFPACRLLRHVKQVVNRLGYGELPSVRSDQSGVSGLDQLAEIADRSHSPVADHNAYARRFTVVADERLQALAQLRRFRPHPFQSGDDFLHLSGPQILGDLVHPTVGLRRAFPVAELSKFPGVFQSVQEIEDFTRAQTFRRDSRSIPLRRRQ